MTVANVLLTHCAVSVPLPVNRAILCGAINHVGNSILLADTCHWEKDGMPTTSGLHIAYMLRNPGPHGLSALPVVSKEQNVIHAEMTAVR